MRLRRRPKGRCAPRIAWSNPRVRLTQKSATGLPDEITVCEDCGWVRKSPHKPWERMHKCGGAGVPSPSVVFPSGLAVADRVALQLPCKSISIPSNLWRAKNAREMMPLGKLPPIGGRRAVRVYSAFAAGGSHRRRFRLIRGPECLEPGPHDPQQPEHQVVRLRGDAGTEMTEALGHATAAAHRSGTTSRCAQH